MLYGVSIEENVIYMSSKYQDYIFKDGSFVGQFDKMYEESDEIPWCQDKTAFSLAVDLDIAILKKYCKKDSATILDIGCGLGYLTNRIREEIPHKKIMGIDISHRAVDKAKKIFPKIDFMALDLMRASTEEIKKIGQVDFIYIKDVIWYVVDEIDLFMENITKLLNVGGYIYHAVNPWFNRLLWKRNISKC